MFVKKNQVKIISDEQVELHNTESPHEYAPQLSEKGFIIYFKKIY